ncbi:MAG: OmpA family protein [Candidatus Marinarcus sp.]|uniref:OmpA family protein n=1 Tax=Candidatus Marinarcus sp. TaxID=3100987 RepID=UPI003B00206A
MKKILLSTVLSAVILLAANNDYKYEITPMIGGAYTEGNLNLDRNYTNIGLALGFNLEESMFDQVELGILRTLQSVDYENSAGKTSITRMFANVIKEYPLTNNSAVYALVGAGVEVFSKDQFNNNDGLFGNYGFGYKYTFDNDMALKFDLRHLIESDHADNNLLYTVGLAIPFGQKAANAPAEEKAVAQEEKQETQASAVNPDMDNDGVLNASDKCPNTPANDIVNANGCTIVVNLKVNFDTDKSLIKPSYDGKIEKFATILKKYPKIKTTLSAHTDSVGEEKYNLALSQRRANSVKQALIELDVPENRIKTIGYGESQPIGNNNTVDGRAQNRRVEATVSK